MSFPYVHTHLYIYICTNSNFIILIIKGWLCLSLGHKDWTTQQRKHLKKSVPLCPIQIDQSSHECFPSFSCFFSILFSMWKHLQLWWSRCCIKDKSLLQQLYCLKTNKFFFFCGSFPPHVSHRFEASWLVLECTDHWRLAENVAKTDEKKGKAGEQQLKCGWCSRSGWLKS